jgi:hypothetical protein
MSSTSMSSMAGLAGEFVMTTLVLDTSACASPRASSSARTLAARDARSRQACADIGSRPSITPAQETPSIHGISTA